MVPEIVNQHLGTGIWIFLACNGFASCISNSACNASFGFAILIDAQEKLQTIQKEEQQKQQQQKTELQARVIPCFPSYFS